MYLQPKRVKTSPGAIGPSMAPTAPDGPSTAPDGPGRPLNGPSTAPNSPSTAPDGHNQIFFIFWYILKKCSWTQNFSLSIKKLRKN